MKSLGIIPAAGKSERFGGVLKELLPAKDGLSFMQHAVNHLLPVCSVIAIVTNKDKIHTHASNIKGVFFIEQQNKLDLLGAIQSAMKIEANRYYMIMPDTFICGVAFNDCVEDSDLSIGFHETMKAGRFGYLMGNKIVDKAPDVKLPALGWGVLSWSNSVRDAFFYFDNLADVLNSIMINGYASYNIGKYYDLANIGEYVEYLRDNDW